MAVEIIDAFNGLAEQGLLSWSDALAVRTITEPKHATAWIVASALELDHMYNLSGDRIDPHEATYDELLASRISNTGDSVRWLNDLPDREQKGKLWRDAASASRTMPPTEIDALRTYMDELRQFRAV